MCSERSHSSEDRDFAIINLPSIFSRHERSALEEKASVGNLMRLFYMFLQLLNYTWDI